MADRKRRTTKQQDRGRSGDLTAHPEHHAGMPDPMAGASATETSPGETNKQRAREQAAAKIEERNAHVQAEREAASGWPSSIIEPAHAKAEQRATASQPQHAEPVAPEPARRVRRRAKP